jgi:hypothetical protein
MLLRIVPPTLEFAVPADGSVAVPAADSPVLATVLATLPLAPALPPLPPPADADDALLAAPAPAPAPTATAPTPVAAITAATVVVNAASTPSGWPAQPMVFQTTMNRMIGNIIASAADT